MSFHDQHIWILQDSKHQPLVIVLDDLDLNVIFSAIYIKNFAIIEFGRSKWKIEKIISKNFLLSKSNLGPINNKELK